MGTQFSWFYDVLVAGIILGVIYKCMRQGFVTALLGIIASILAFYVSLTLSAPVTEWVYGKWISPAVNERLSASDNSGFSEKTGGDIFGGIYKIDMSKATVNGAPISDLTLTFDADGKAVLDLTEVDFSETGLMPEDLAFLGVANAESTDALKVNAGKITVTAREFAESDLETIILAKTLTYIAGRSDNSGFTDFYAVVSGALPEFGFFEADDAGLVTKLLIGVIKSRPASLEQAVNENLVRPSVIVPLRSLIFLLIFVIIGIGVSVLLKISRIINKIPLAGAINSFLGAVFGVFEAAVIVFLVCIGVRVLISLTGDSIIFLNTMTIEETAVFKYIYDMDFLIFLRG